MGLLRDAWNVITFRNLPYAQIEQRASLVEVVPAWRENKVTYPDTDPGVYDRDAYRKQALIFRCVSMLANSVAEAPLRVMQQAEPEPKELPSHRMRRLITRPNPRMGESRFMGLVTMTLATSGFCVVQKVRSNAGIPVQLWPLRSDLLYPILKSQAAPDWEYRIKRVTPEEWDGRISDNGFPIIDAKDAIVMTWADRPDHSPMGIGPLEIALREWGLLNDLQDFLKGYIATGVMPRWGLKITKEGGLGKGDNARQAADLIREMWAGRFMGMNRRNPADVPLLETVEPVRLDDSLEDMALMGLRNVSELAICQAFGIHPTMVAQYFGLEHSTYSNAETYKQSYYEETIVPLWSRIDDALTFGLLADIELDPSIFIQFDTSDIAALQEDINLKRTHYLEALRAGAITRADYKRTIGIPADEQADNVYLMPFNVVEVPAGSSAPLRGSERVTWASVREVSHNSQYAALPSGAFDSRGRVVPEMRARIQERAVNRYGATARLFSPRIMLFFREQGRRVVSTLNERSAVPGLETRDVAELIDDAFWMNEDEELRAVLEQLWDSMGQQAVDDVSGLLSLGDGALTWDLANPWVQDVQSLVATRVTNVNETTKQQIREIVTDALNEGTSMPDLAEKLRGTFEETYRGRSETIARTESQVSYNEASAAGYRESGVREIELMDNVNHTTDPGSDGLTCSQRNGMVVPTENASRHIAAEHPNGTLAIAPVIRLGAL